MKCLYDVTSNKWAYRPIAVAIDLMFEYCDCVHSIVTDVAINMTEIS